MLRRPVVLGVGAEWIVAFHAMKTRWNSRSRAVEVDREAGRFAYRSQSDDGNPSYADWRWQLSGVPGGTRVDVEVDIRPRTFWRRRLLSDLRRPVLRTASTASPSSRPARTSARRVDAASAPVTGDRWGRGSILARYTSAAASSRPAGVRASPLRPLGYPDPSRRSWCWTAMAPRGARGAVEASTRSVR